jgi:hypothetical protein
VNRERLGLLMHSQHFIKWDAHMFGGFAPTRGFLDIHAEIAGPQSDAAHIWPPRREDSSVPSNFV